MNSDSEYVYPGQISDMSGDEGDALSMPSSFAPPLDESFAPSSSSFSAPLRSQSVEVSQYEPKRQSRDALRKVKALAAPLPVMSISVERLRDVKYHALKCCICLDLLQDPVTFNECGHHVCEICIRNVNLEDGMRKCPMCRKVAVKTTVLPNKFLARWISELEVRCDHEACTKIYALGTHYAGERGHAAECDFLLLECEACKSPNIMNKDMDMHEELFCPHRTVRCKMCSEKVSHQLIDEHLTTGSNLKCQGFIPCPKNCKVPFKRRSSGELCEQSRCIIRRADVQAHLLDECVENIIECNVCPRTFARKNMVRHFMDMAHEHCAILMARTAPEPSVPSSVTIGSSYRRISAQVVLLPAVLSSDIALPKFEIEGERLTIRLRAVGGTKAQVNAGAGRLNAELIFLKAGVRNVSLVVDYALKVSLLYVALEGDLGSDVVHGFNVAARPHTSSLHAFTTSFDGDTRRFDVASVERFHRGGKRVLNESNQYGVYFELHKRPNAEPGHNDPNSIQAMLN